MSQEPEVMLEQTVLPPDVNIESMGDVNFSELEALANILPENRASYQYAGQSPAIVPNLSTAVVARNEEPFDARSVQAAMQAQSGMSEHINLFAPFVQGGLDQINVAKNEYADIAKQLERVRLPDTNVNIFGRDLKSSWNVKQYGNGQNQAVYVQLIHALLGKERVTQLLKHCTKANQMNEPALWLNQHLELEAQQQYVWMLSQNQTVKRIELKPDLENAATKILRTTLGPDLSTRVEAIAKSQQLSNLQVFIILVDKVLGTHAASSKAKSTQSIWEEFTVRGEEQAQPVMTAEYAKILMALRR